MKSMNFSGVVYAGETKKSASVKTSETGTGIVRVSTNETCAPIMTISVERETIRLARKGSANAMRAIARNAAKVLGIKGIARYVNGHMVKCIVTDRKTGVETTVATICISL
jgi:hypothetical protein